MRKIKFRAWDKEEKEMLYGNETTDTYDWEGIISTELAMINSLCKKTELMQYTGLKDKNDKEIYEGDIVKNRHGANWIIKWSDRKNGWGLFYTHNATMLLGAFTETAEKNHKVEVIGNIHENPELLEKDG